MMNDVSLNVSPENIQDMSVEEVWNQAFREIVGINPESENWKVQALPLAKVKKIMKSEEFILQEMEKQRLQSEGKEVSEKQNPKFMIAAEAPVLMTKACELLIRELTARAWQHTEKHRRRTLQRPDLHAAVGESDMFDFLIDIVPRVTTNPVRPPATVGVNFSSLPMGIATADQQQHIPLGMMNPSGLDFSTNQFTNMFFPNFPTAMLPDTGDSDNSNAGLGATSQQQSNQQPTTWTDSPES